MSCLFLHAKAVGYVIELYTYGDSGCGQQLVFQTRESDIDLKLHPQLISISYVPNTTGIYTDFNRNQ